MLAPKNARLAMILAIIGASCKAGCDGVDSGGSAGPMRPAMCSCGGTFCLAALFNGEGPAGAQPWSGKPWRRYHMVGSVAPAASGWNIGPNSGAWSLDFDLTLFFRLQDSALELKAPAPKSASEDMLSKERSFPVGSSHDSLLRT